MRAWTIARSTWTALLAPKRLVPILGVTIPLLWAQRVYSWAPEALWVGLALCLAFVLVAPVSYRVLFDGPIDAARGVLRVIVFAAIGAAVVFALGVWLPRSFGVEATFMTARGTLVIDVALFLAGGWGLGRDVGLEERVEALAREAERAQLLAIKANLDPHFLFNTLNAIAELCRTDGATAERAVLELASLLREVLAGIDSPSWPLARELDVCKMLLSLHRMRDPDRFTAVWDVDDGATSVPIPPMLLFALVENAMTHGPSKGHRGEVRVSARRDEKHVVVRITNPGPFAGPRAGSHGLPTVERRLALAYDGRASLRVSGEDGEDGARTVAIVELPALNPEAV
ncbi:MAG TPA: histidine kinase [Polyangiaceae bacterium]|nr:histidine kinase [Polyangiaceae bacterium]